MGKPRILAIIGPTASGKTNLAIKTSESLQNEFKKEVEIISADSRQVYKHIPIATAQPSKTELNKFKHYFVNELELENEFNAGDFGKKGREIIKKIISSGKIPIIVGGSGLYIDSLVNGLFDYEELADDADLKKSQKHIREKLYDELKSHGFEKLVNELKNVDPETIKDIPQVTERRVIRALEVYYSTGIPISIHKSKKINIEFNTVKTGIKHDREELYNRINNRVDAMLANGLIEEIKTLKAKGYHYKDYNSLNTVGVKEVFDMLDEKISYDRMIELIRQNTRRFAKRQMTWFRRCKDIKWIDKDSEILKIFKSFTL